MPGPVTEDVDLNKDTPGKKGHAKGGLAELLDEKLGAAFDDSGKPIEQPESKEEPKETPKPEAKEEPKEAPKPESKEEPKPKEEPKGEEKKEFSLEVLEDPDAKPAEEKEEPEVEEEEEVPEDVKEQGEKAVARWGELKKAEKDLKVAQKRIEELESSSKKPGPEDTKKVEELEKTISEYEERLAVVDVRASAKYQREVTEPFIELEKEARGIANDEEHADQIISALSNPDLKARAQQLTEATEDLPQYLQTKLFRIADEVDKVEAHKQKLVSNASEALKELQQDELAQHGKETSERRQAREGAADKVWDHLQSEIPFLTDDDGALRPEFQKVRDDGRVLNLQDPSTKLATLVYSAYAGRMLPGILNTAQEAISTRDAKISELQQAVSELTASSPGGGRKTTTSSTPSGDEPGGRRKTFLERMDEEIESGKVTFGS